MERDPVEQIKVKVDGEFTRGMKNPVDGQFVEMGVQEVCGVSDAQILTQKRQRSESPVFRRGISEEVKWGTMVES